MIPFYQAMGPIGMKNFSRVLDEAKHGEVLEVSVMLPPAGLPDANGHVFTEDAMKAMAEQFDGKTLVYNNKLVKLHVQTNMPVSAPRVERK